jgi:Na+/melibiose symporter-like transporter
MHGQSRLERRNASKAMGLILLIIVILLLIGAFPTGGYGWGYRSHGLLGTILIIILILWLLGRI